MKHPEIEEKLSEYLSNELSSNEKARIEQHLAECSSCKEELEALKITISAVKNLSRIEAPSDLLVNVREKIEKPRFSFLGLFRNKAMLLGSASIAVVLIVVVYLLQEKPSTYIENLDKSYKAKELKKESKSITPMPARQRKLSKSYQPKEESAKLDRLQTMIEKTKQKPPEEMRLRDGEFETGTAGVAGEIIDKLEKSDAKKEPAQKQLQMQKEVSGEEGEEAAESTAPGAPPKESEQQPQSMLGGSISKDNKLMFGAPKKSNLLVLEVTDINKSLNEVNEFVDKELTEKRTKSRRRMIAEKGEEQNKGHYAGGAMALKAKKGQEAEEKTAEHILTIKVPYTKYEVFIEKLKTLGTIDETNIKKDENKKYIRITLHIKLKPPVSK